MPKDMDILRRRMVDRLLERGVIQSNSVAGAFSRVPRHVFLEGVIPARQAYFDQAVMLKFPGSSVSQPQVIATMLEILQLEPGMKILEIGTASGYNAALLADIAGDDSLVFSIEREAGLISRARDNLSRGGYPGVNIRPGDGTLGWPEKEKASFDRIIITAQTEIIPPKLIEQLKVGGRLVTPLVLSDGAILLVRLEKGERILGRAFPFPVTFVPLKGEGIKHGCENWRRDLNNLWRGIQPFCRAFPLDSPRLWGVFLFLLNQVLEGKVRERPESLWYKWQAEGRPKINEWILEFNREGLIKSVFRQEE